jgi:hypothetical protein
MSKSKSTTKASGKETKGAKRTAADAKPVRARRGMKAEPEATVAPQAAETKAQALEAAPAKPTAAPVTESAPPARKPARKGRPSATSGAESVKGDAGTPETAGTTEQPKEKKPRGRFATMSIADLQALYVEKVGRPSGSSHRGYLIWKIREAEKGRITVGPVKARTASGEPRDMKVLPLSLETTTVEKMDAAWRAKGIKTRMEFLRKAIGAYLTHMGATEEAALVAAE